MSDNNNQSVEDLLVSAQRLGEEGKIDLACKEYEEALSKTNDQVHLMNIHHNLGHLILFRTIGTPKYTPTKDDISGDEVIKAHNHFYKAIEIFKKQSLEKKQEYAELYEELEKKRKLAWTLGLKIGAEQMRKDVEEKKKKEGEGCFIATAAYGTPCTAELQILREFRNEHLLKNAFGRLFVNAYYQVSPSIASHIEKHGIAKLLTRTILIEPMLWIIKNFGVFRR